MHSTIRKLSTLMHSVKYLMPSGNCQQCIVLEYTVPSGNYNVTMHCTEMYSALRELSTISNNEVPNALRKLRCNKHCTEMYSSLRELSTISINEIPNALRELHTIHCIGINSALSSGNYTNNALYWNTQCPRGTTM